MNKKNIRPELPLFPLPLVLFPSANLPLTIFEDKYKLMFDDVLSGDRQFGVVLSENGRIAKIGCIATVDKFVKFANGSFELSSTGTERFAIKEISNEKLYLTANVEVMEDQLPVEVESYRLASEMRGMLDDIIGLSAKMVDSSLKVNEVWPTDPSNLSFMVPDTFFGSNEHKQKLLETIDLSERLESEINLLQQARSFLAAQLALKEAVG